MKVFQVFKRLLVQSQEVLLGPANQRAPPVPTLAATLAHTLSLSHKRHIRWAGKTKYRRADLDFDSFVLQCS